MNILLCEILIVKAEDSMSQDVKNGRFRIFKENGELAVDDYEEWLAGQTVTDEETGAEGFPLYLFDKLILCELYKLLKEHLTHKQGE